MSDQWGFAKDFHLQFQTAYSDLKSRCDSAGELQASERTKDLLDGLMLDLAKLTKSLGDATGMLPNHDQRAYELQLKSLETSLERIRASAAPKSKFAFRRKTPAATPSGESETGRIVGTADASERKEIEDKTKTPVPAAHWSISSFSERQIGRDILPPSDQPSDLLISDLDSCTVNLLTPAGSPNVLKISALHVRDLRNTTLMLPVIAGSALLHDLNKCVVVVGCHQFRMHTSTDVDVYLSITSNPIIEDCKGVRFGEYPAEFVQDDVKISTISDVQPKDFSHIKPTPSPNWTFMPPGHSARRELGNVIQKAFLE